MIATLSEGPPYPIYLARASDDFWPPEWLQTWYLSKTLEWFKAKGLAVVSRGVSLDRLQFVLENGIDVPPGAPLWVEIGIEKAWEYGGSPKLLLVLAQEALQPAHLVLPSSTPEQELEVYKTQYQTVLRREDRGEIYLSRLKPTDRRVGSGYEQAYCRFPAGDPRNCLVAIIIVLPPNAPTELIMRLLASQQTSTSSNLLQETADQHRTP